MSQETCYCTCEIPSAMQTGKCHNCHLPIKKKMFAAGGIVPGNKVGEDKTPAYLDPHEAEHIRIDGLLKAGFDHPCKQTCSGWKQGYERGVYEYQSKSEFYRGVSEGQQALLTQLRIELNRVKTMNMAMTCFIERVSEEETQMEFQSGKGDITWEYVKTELADEATLLLKQISEEEK